MTSPRLKRVFISYSHDSEEHRDWVLSFANQLRSNAIDAWIDRYVASPPEGWPRWMQRQLEEAECVLLVCTEPYKRRFEGREPVAGKGAAWEGLLAEQILYDNLSRNRVFIPVVPPGGDTAHIPLALRPFTYYSLGAAPGCAAYQALCRHIQGVPEVVPHPLPASVPLEALELLADDRSEVVAGFAAAESEPAEVAGADAELETGPGGEPCTRIELLSPLAGHVYHSGVVSTKYGPEAPVWNTLVVDEKRLLGPEGEVRELQPFLVVVGLKTKEAVSIVANNDTRLWVRDPVPHGTTVAVGDRIATLLISTESTADPPFIVSRGVSYGGVLKYRPRITDRFWRGVGPSTPLKEFVVTEHRTDPQSGVLDLLAPSAGVFEEAPRFHYRPGKPVRSGDCLGYILRGKHRTEVRSGHAGVLLATLVGATEAVHAGQALFRLRVAPPCLHLTVMPHATENAGWFQLFSPLAGQFQLEPRSAAAHPLHDAGSSFERSVGICAVNTGDIVAKIGLDIAGQIMEVNAVPGGQVRIGSPLLIVKAERVLVRAPMVGNFYRARYEEAPPYVEIGQRVTRGDSLCEIESSKLYNEIWAEYSGIVTEIHVENGDPVEYGQPLFTIALTR